ncbi:MAG: hypothetical protein FJZ95_01085 [Chloroflexi bacterium]|nr:hypothetical protein [Chloroflexota bacterium]
MRSDIISRVEKANRYAGERDRINFRNFSVSFRGTHDTHLTSFQDGKWVCTCNSFAKWETCAHVMAMQKVLGDMLPEDARSVFV